MFLFTGKTNYLLTFYLKSCSDLVVVNSKRGISRSATIVVGYIMHTEGLTYTEAVKDVRTKRKIRIAAAQFRELLKDIECTKNRKKTRGGTSLPRSSPLDQSLLPEKEGDADHSDNVDSPPLPSDASEQPLEDSDIVDSPPLPSDPPPEKEINNVK